MELSLGEKLVGIIQIFVAGQHPIFKLNTINDPPSYIPHNHILMSEEFSSDNASNFYVVESILDKKYIRKNGRVKAHYLIRWEGYVQQTWEPIQNLSEVKAMVRQFEQSLKKKQSSQLQKERQNIQSTFHQQMRPSNKRSRPSEGEQDGKNSFQKKASQESDLRRKDSRENEEYYVRQQNKRLEERETKKKSLFSQQQGKKNMFASSWQSYPQKPKDKLSQYGKIINHIYENGKLMYQVQKLNAQLKPVQNVFLESQVAKEECMASLNQYLQRLLIELEEYNKQK